jgi:hypothetical protein
MNELCGPRWLEAELTVESKYALSNVGPIPDRGAIVVTRETPPGRPGGV